MTLIMTTVGDEFINDIADYEKASNAWSHLEKLCCENIDYGVGMKLWELASFRKMPDMLVQNYCNILMNMNRLLSNNR